jgi:tetrathionate reductase subunit B
MATKKHYAFVIDVSRCIDCRACLVACRVENAVPPGHTRNWVKDLGVQGDFPSLSQTFVPYNCMHCDQPPCVEVCPSGATYKDTDTGLVQIDQKACIGCGLCIPACPYSARYLDEQRGVADKCNGCIQRVEQGQQPACVQTCVGDARMFGDLNDPDSRVSVALKNARTMQRLATEQVNTGPNVYYINGDVQQAALLPHQPGYTTAETFWRKVVVPAVAAGVGLAFLGQAGSFAKQLLDGEKDFED